MIDSQTRQYRVPDYGAIPLSEILPDDIENFRHIANRPLGELCLDENPDLLVFPDKQHLLETGLSDGVICSMDRNRLETGDVMGFVGRNGSQLTICSRFAAEDSEDYLLHYMVRKVFDISLFDLKHASSRNRVFDFLAYLFPYHLKRALKQGLYKKYVTNAYNDSHLKGAVDLRGQIRWNTPFVGNIAYTTKEFSYDNDLTQLIRHTIECIRTSAMASVLKTDTETDAYVLQICRATPSYKSPDRDKILSKNLRPITHPYYLAYRPLQRLCVQILTHRGLKYGRHNNDIYGLLFSGSWLWEEFLYKSVLCDCGFRHPQNRSGKGSIYLFDQIDDGEKHPGGRCRRYPDYVKDDFILDAKYKRLDNRSIDRDDMHQIISYMHVERAALGGFIFPQGGAQSGVVAEKLGTLRGYGGAVYRIGVPIPRAANSYKDFVAQMAHIQKKLKHTICDEIA